MCIHYIAKIIGSPPSNERFDRFSNFQLTESSFLFDLSYTQRHCHVRIEKGSVQIVAIKLEAHNSLEYHYMLKH